MPLLHISGKGVFTAFLGSLRHFNFSHSYLFLIFVCMPLFIFLYLGGPGGPPQQGYQQPQHPGYPPAFQQPYPETYPQSQGFFSLLIPNKSLIQMLNRIHLTPLQFFQVSQEEFHCEIIDGSQCNFDFSVSYPYLMFLPIFSFLYKIKYLYD